MSATKQPIWKFIANIGDVNPIEYGGLFIYTDATGVYPPEMERIERESDDDDARIEVHRVILEPCTFINGILSDNPYHPDHPVWFAEGINGIAATMDRKPDELIADFCSDDPLRRAEAWREVFDYHGWENGDSYPLHLTVAEAEARYTNGELG